ncbi:MAG: hypothetical protein ACE5FW_02030 [Candidatus Aenigmatarchaeota archaeon]
MMAELDTKTKEQIKRNLKEGWIKSSLIIEVLATSEDAAKSALEKHVKQLGEENGVLVYKKDWGGFKKVDKPFKDIETAYSYFVELEMLTRNFERLVYLVMNYGPTSVEILEPKHIKLDMGEAQGILVSLADIIHKFAQMGIGGIVIRT